MTLILIIVLKFVSTEKWSNLVMEIMKTYNYLYLGNELKYETEIW